MRHNAQMTFPLGSLTDSAHTRGVTSTGSGLPAQPTQWRLKTAVFLSAVVWLIALLALLTHSPYDAAFSTSGDGSGVHNRAGVLGAWGSDLAFVFFGYSAWWLMAVALRTWLSALARLLRGGTTASEQPPLWWLAVGVWLLLGASCALEWTRVYGWEAHVAGGPQRIMECKRPDSNATRSGFPRPNKCC